MGRGKIRQRNAIKKQYLGQAVKYIEQLEAENEALKTNPDSVIGQIVPQMRELLSQNKRLSVLAAALMKAQGGKITVPRDDMESFEGYSLRVKWELPEGVDKVEDAKEFVFTYEAIETPKEDEADAEAPTVGVMETPADAPAPEANPVDNTSLQQ